MKEEEKRLYTKISYACSIVFCTVGFLILRMVFNFYYDLNDDILIKDILSGLYTGTPDGHCVQMLYPLSWIVKTLYSINADIPWFGIMEIGLTWLCGVLIIARTQYIVMRNVNRKKTKFLGVACVYLCVTLFMMGLELWEIVMYQYTVLSGTLAVTATYLFFTEEDFKVNENIVPIILLVLSFNMRTEMFLLMCPFIAVAGMCKWVSEGFEASICKKYITYVAVIALSLVASLAVNAWAYRSEEWKEFIELFDARTTIYDFTGVPDFESNREFYDAQLVYESDYERLVDYNYVLSDRVNAHLMTQLAEYAKDHNAKSKTVPYAVFEVVKDVASWRMPSQKAALTDESNPFYEEGIKIHVPYNIIIVLLYILAMIAAIYAKDIKWAYMLPLILLMRSVCWGYISYKGRINARIAHPLYFMEAIMLVAVLLVAWGESYYKSAKTRSRICWLLTTAFVASTTLIGIFIPSNISDIQNKSKLREAYNMKAVALYEYTASNPRDYFLLDVYSTVSFSERFFVEKEYVHSKANTQLAGGWIALSPLDAYKSGFYKDEARFVTANSIDGIECIDEIKSTDKKDTWFYVYNVSDVKNCGR